MIFLKKSGVLPPLSFGEGGMSNTQAFQEHACVMSVRNNKNVMK